MISSLLQGITFSTFNARPKVGLIWPLRCDCGSASGQLHSNIIQNHQPLVWRLCILEWINCTWPSLIHCDFMGALCFFSRTPAIYSTYEWVRISRQDFHWIHACLRRPAAVYVPLLPNALVDFCGAPLPFARGPQVESGNVCWSWHWEEVYVMFGQFVEYWVVRL